jgi:cysteinyl-tRNA synthetase
VPLPVLAALEDDLNTPLAISHLHELAGALNRTSDARERVKAARTLYAAAAPLGLLSQHPEAWFRWQPAGAATLSAEQIERLIVDRQAARKSRNYAESDRIRSLLATEGVQLEDGPDGTTWKRSA